MRPKKGTEFWNKKKQFVAFYTLDEDPVMQFDSIYEIIDWKGIERTKTNYDIVTIELYRALQRDTHYTEMLGSPMTVYLIDNDD